MRKSPVTFITENADSWLPSIIPNGCVIGKVSSKTGESYVQYFIGDIDRAIHYEVVFFDEKCKEYWPQLKRYEVGKVYVELHVEVPSGKKWMEKHHDFLFLLNEKFLLLNKKYKDSYIKEWGVLKMRTTKRRVSRSG